MWESLRSDTGGIRNRPSIVIPSKAKDLLFAGLQKQISRVVPSE